MADKEKDEKPKEPSRTPIPINDRCGKCGDRKHKDLCMPWN